jgi:uncharacterized protein (TIGR02268 family)
LFNAKLDRGAVERAGRELGFARVAVAEDTLVVVPAQDSKTGARLPLPVRFAGGEAHEEVAVVFVVDPPHAEAYVQVVRRARTVPALEDALVAALARGAALEATLETRDAELASVRAEKTSMATLIEAGMLGRDGIRAMNLGAVTWKPAQDGAGTAWLYVGAGRVTFEMELTLAAHARPWALGEPRLLPGSEGASPIPASVAQLLGVPALAPGDRARLVVEFEVPTDDPRMKYSLEVTEQDGNRALRLSDLKLAAPAARKQ